MKCPLSFSDISVVIQGAVSDATYLLIDSIHRLMPGAEIIISTWEGTVIRPGVLVDKLVKSSDPGAVPGCVDGVRPYNINRQILSSKVGIDVASRPYILKCRSDLCFDHIGFLNYWDEFDCANPNFALAKHKIIIPSLYTIESEKLGKTEHYTPFHISDWCCFGCREDIELLHALPLVDAEDFSKYFLYHKKPKDYPILWLNERLWRFPPEQYLGLEFAKKKFPNLEMESTLDNCRVPKEFNEAFLANNFIILDNCYYGCYLNKGGYYEMSRDYSFLPPHIRESIYDLNKYERLYEKYCTADLTLEFPTCGNLSKACPETTDFALTIITPTYINHFKCVDIYLRTFNKFVLDKKEIQICFIIEMKDFFEFIKIISKYNTELNIRILFTEQLLCQANIKESPDELLKKYGRFSYQSLKKYYAMLSQSSKKYFVLDSESCFVKPIKLIELMEEYYTSPKLIYSPRFLLGSRKCLKDYATENIQDILNYDTNKWHIEDFCWFYDREILDKMFFEYGTPIELVRKLRRGTDRKKRDAGLFEILLYRVFIEKHIDEFPEYKFVDAYEVMKKHCSTNEVSSYSNKVLRQYGGESGYIEHFSLFISTLGLKRSISYINELNPYVLRFETFNLQQYVLQRFLLKHTNIPILAASHDHWHLGCAFRKAKHKYISSIVKKAKKVISKIKRISVY